MRKFILIWACIQLGPFFSAAGLWAGGIRSVIQADKAAGYSLLKGRLQFQGRTIQLKENKAYAPEGVRGLLACLDLLPKQMRRAGGLTADCDGSGRYWTVGSRGAYDPKEPYKNIHDVILDVRERRILYRVPEGWEASMSPDARYCVLSNVLRDVDSPVAGRILRFPQMTTLLDEKRGFCPERFLDKGRYAYGEVGRTFGYVDLENPGLFHPLGGDFRQLMLGAGVEVDGGSRLLFDLGRQDGTDPGRLAMLRIPSLEVVRTFPDLPQNPICASPDGPLYCLNDGSAFYFYNASTGKMRGFALSGSHPDTLVETRRKSLPAVLMDHGSDGVTFLKDGTVLGGKRAGEIRGVPVGLISLRDLSEKDLPAPGDQEVDSISEYMDRTADTYGEELLAVPDAHGIWAAFEYVRTGKGGDEGKMAFLHVNKGLKIDELRVCDGVVQAEAHYFDPSTHVLTVQAFDGQVYTFHLE